MTAVAPTLWPLPDGTPVSCREKLRVLQENHAELQQVLRDAFEDAVLMGVDEAAMRRILIAMVDSLESPKRTGPAQGGAQSGAQSGPESGPKSGPQGGSRPQ